MAVVLYHEGYRLGGESCWCHTCDAAAAKRVREAHGADVFWLPRFIVCPECGNKRCPKANLHSHPCTGSNEPGQKGSAYE